MLQTKNYIKFFLFVLLAQSVAARETDELEQLAKSLFPNNNQKFATDCDYQKAKWLESLLTRQPFELNIQFTKTCDIQGKNQVKPFTPFSFTLTLRNHPSFHKVVGNFFYQIEFKEKPELILKLKSAKATGKRTIHFDMNYKFIVNLLEADPLQENKGGELIIHSLDGKKINKRYPLSLY